jgi:hypothetical protein
LVKTTPKPNATKNSKGELVAPPPGELLDAEVADPNAGPVVEVPVDMMIDTVSERICEYFKTQSPT